MKDVTKYWQDVSQNLSFFIQSLNDYSTMISDLNSKVYDKNVYWTMHIANTTFFTHIYSTLENYLYQICEKIKVYSNEKFSIEDFEARNYLESAKKYISITTGINIGQIKEWNYIKNCQKVRNSIIHNHCKSSVRISSIKQDALYTFLQRYGHLIDGNTKPQTVQIVNLINEDDLMHYMFHIIRNDLNEDFIKEIDNFLFTLIKMVHKFYTAQDLQ
jgi:hypothetical protein